MTCVGAPVQSSWDEAYEQKWPLWRSYHQCVDRARQRNTKRRQSSFKNLDLPDGRKVQFSHNDRANIDPAILARIRWSACMSTACCMCHSGRQ